MIFDKMRAQISLEYIIILSALFSVILVFMPMISETYEAGLFAIDVLNAKTFSNNFSNSLSELNFFSDGARKTFEINPLNTWEIECKNRVLKITITNPEISNEKVIHNTIPDNIICKLTISEKTKITIEKQFSKISVKHS